MQSGAKHPPHSSCWEPGGLTPGDQTCSDICCRGLFLGGGQSEGRGAQHHPLKDTVPHKDPKGSSSSLVNIKLIWKYTSLAYSLTHASVHLSVKSCNQTDFPQQPASSHTEGVDADQEGYDITVGGDKRGPGTRWASLMPTQGSLTKDQEHGAGRMARGCYFLSSTCWVYQAPHRRCFRHGVH